MEQPEVNGVETGFILAQRLERISTNGAPHPGRERWSASVGRSVSFDSYLLDLLFEPPGIYRAVALGVTCGTLGATRRRASSQMGGFHRGLGPDIDALPLEGCRADALVYTFERRRGGQLLAGYRYSPDGLAHLKASGMWDVLASFAKR